MTSARLAWAMFGISVVSNTAGLVLVALLPAGSLEGEGDQSLLLSAAFTLTTLVFALVGAIVASRLPANPIGWLFCGAGVVLGMESATYGYAAFALVAHPGLPGGVVTAWLSSWLWLPALLGVPSLLFLLFPDGRPSSRRWMLVIPFIVTGLICQVAGSAFAPGSMQDSSVPETENPVGIKPGILTEVLQLTGWTMGLVSIVLATCSLVLRFRGSRGIERQQLKWFAWSAGLLPGFLLTGVLADVTTEGAGSSYADYVLPLILSVVPISAGMAILRHRLYDIDLVINRTLVYGALTVTLAGAYLGLILLFQSALNPVTSESDLAVAASTLAVAALFRPLRARIQATVDRRFYRRRYDAAHTLESFSLRLRDELDLESLTSDLRSVAHETVQPAHVSLWLRSSP